MTTPKSTPQRRRPPSKRTATPAGGRRAAPANTGSHLQRGGQARQKAKEESEKTYDRSTWRFFLQRKTAIDVKTGKPFNECGLLILDNSLEDIVGQYEHNLKINGEFGNFEGCPKEWDNCCLCDERGDRAYYALFFSVFALRPWKGKKSSGDGTKMLLPVKSAQTAKFEAICAAAEAEHGTLRGTFLHMVRDVANENSAAIGEPAILEGKGGPVYAHYTEEELVSNWGHAAIIGERGKSAGKVLKPENDDIHPFDYETEFPKPDAADLRKRYGGRAQAGSEEEAQDEWGAGADEGTSGEPEKRTAPTKRRPPAPAAHPDGADGEPQTKDDMPF